MSEQFYTPSLGDEVLDLTECEPCDMNLGVGDTVPQQLLQSRAEMNVPTQITMAARKQVQTTGYTEFFREKAIVIKKEKPEINFNELSQIVKNLWQTLSVEEKSRYNDSHTTFSTVTVPKENSTVVLSSSEDEPSPNGISGAAEEIFGGTVNKQAPSAAVTAAPVESKTEVQTVDETAEQMLNEASGARKCTRENCNKRAIINPDWEDEYCSNECVILHCRSVFSSWVDASKSQKKNPQN